VITNCAFFIALNFGIKGMRMANIYKTTKEKICVPLMTHFTKSL
jgi:hypothetical protein